MFVQVWCWVFVVEVNEEATDYGSLVVLMVFQEEAVGVGFGNLEGDVFGEVKVWFDLHGGV
ncbi:MAG: hypothetical protein O4803_03290 [Trichodesmium sp. St15_bin1_1]|nr:hypothetical protein [Trichodesmium sp. St15_bin1_1]MDE5119228.1 hypothetical protein [Trichodesmium sp. St19_bin1]